MRIVEVSPVDFVFNIRGSLPALIRVVRALGLFFLIVDVAGQYRLDTWTTDNGLPQNSVTGLAQTPDQYLWFTTNDGLVRFDGVRFKVFNKSNTPQITTNRLSAAFVDKSGLLWFQGEDGSILFYRNGAFTIAAKPRELQPGTLSRFFDDGAGGVVVNRDRQPYGLQNGKFAPLFIEGLPANAPVILTDRRGALWFCDKDILYSFQNGQLAIQSIAGKFNGQDYFVGYDDSQGNVWAGFFTNQEESLLRIRNGQVREIELPNDTVNQFVEDAHGNLWLSIYSKGIYRIDRAEVAGEELSGDVIKPVMEMQGLSTNKSGHLLFDREGGLWVGTERGLNRISPETVNVLSKRDGLNEENVYPLLEDRKGIIWAGVWPNNLVKYEDGRFTTKISDETVFVTSLFEDQNNRIWFGTLGNVFYMDGEKPVRFTAETGFPDPTEFSAIYQTADGALWFGTSRGLSRHHNNKSTIFTVQDGLPDDYVVALLGVNGGNGLWIGTRGGLALFESGAFRPYTSADGLASNYIRSLYEDSEGVLWIGSYDGGLTRLKDGRFTVYGMSEGLSSNGVFCIVEDAAGWFWMNSNQGIYRVSRRELNDFADGKIRSVTSISYNKQDGLLNVEGNGGRQPAAIRDRSGKLWFPTAQGIAVVDPSKVAINQIAPPVLIEEVVIERAAVPNDAFQSAVNHLSAIELAPGQNNLEINYTALSFVNSEQLKFRYRLEGQDADWNDVGTRRTAYYAYLPPGEYSFKVIAANRDGIWNEHGATIAIKVNPAFYQTWWFSLVLALIATASVGFVFIMRVRQLHLKAEQQQQFARQLIASQESERGRIAAEMHDGLGQSLAIIKNRAMLSLSKPDDHDHTREQLHEIAEASSEAINEVHDIIYDLRPIQLDRLGLTGALEEIAERVAMVGQLELSMDLDNIDDAFSTQSENSLYRIVQECLNNVVKHAEATAFGISVKKERSKVRITIKDNGKGFRTNRMSEVRDQLGFGILGMSERAKLLGGQTIVESMVGSGTTVSITVPMNLPENRG